jgi:respiratory burst oxidase
MVNDNTEGTKVPSTDVSSSKKARPSLRTADMGSSVRNCMKDFKVKGKQAALDRAFNDLDASKNGLLEREEVAAFMEQAAREIKLFVPNSVIMDAVDALMEDVGALGSNHITKKQFDELFERHPNLLRCFDDEVAVSDLKRKASRRPLTREEIEDKEREDEEVWESMPQMHWKSENVRLFWGFVYFAANIATFTAKGVMYANSPTVKNVFSSCIIISRGSAQCLNLNCCLILLPVCRHVLTRLRATKLRFYFPFDTFLNSHITFGIAILFFTVLHVGGHTCGFINFTYADQEDILLLMEGKNLDVPEGVWDRWKFLLGTTAGITGIIMVVCMLIAYPFTIWRRSKFNTFWYTHHLLLVMLIVLCFHGIGNLLEPFQSVYWMMIPLTLYLIPRFLRETPYSTHQVLDIRVKKGKVVAIKLQRPKNWENLVRPGMYAFLKVPKVSKLEWHPFSLTSAPYEDFIEFHCARAGDWTGRLHDLVETIENDEESDKFKCEHASDLILKVEGPIGASSQGFKDYPIVVLIGAGIGVTPMISVLKQLLFKPGRMKRVFFYWTVRDRAAFEWFTKLMDDIYDSDKSRAMQVRNFLTSVKDDQRDIGAVLLHHATRAKHRRTNFDIILGQYTHRQVEVGRPKWTEELKSVKLEAKSLTYNSCGVFLCGPKAMAVDIATTCFTLTKEDPTFYFHFSKETF